MKSNFFENYCDYRSMDSNLFASLLALNGFVCLVLLGVSFTFSAIVADFLNYMPWTALGLLKFSVIGSVILTILAIKAYGIYHYYKVRGESYALFNTDDLKKWYVLTPEKFVFSSDTDIVYYIHNETIIADGYRKKGFEKNCLDVSKMYPKTFVESIKYSRFVSKTFKAVKLAEKKEIKRLEDIKTQKAIITGNNEMLRVMGSVQKDIGVVLRESNRKIKAEIDKLAELNS